MKRLYPLLACLAFAQVAHAEITATFVQDEDIFGVGINTWILQVTTDTDWQSGEIDIQLDSGNIATDPAGFPLYSPTYSGYWDSGVFGSDLYPPDIAPGWISTATQFTASWGTNAPDDVGTFYIGAFTFSPDAYGTISGRVTAVNPNDPLAPLVFDLEGWSVVRGEVVHSPVTVPEPSTLLLIGFTVAGLVGVLRRRKV